MCVAHVLGMGGIWRVAPGYGTVSFYWELWLLESFPIKMRLEYTIILL